jgi:hypothetical protein
LAKLLGLTVTSVQFDKLPHDIESAFQIARETVRKWSKKLGPSSMTTCSAK